jgi:hypothetical protein
VISPRGLLLLLSMAWLVVDETGGAVSAFSLAPRLLGSTDAAFHRSGCTRRPVADFGARKVAVLRMCQGKEDPGAGQWPVPPQYPDAVEGMMTCRIRYVADGGKIGRDGEIHLSLSPKPKRLA